MFLCFVFNIYILLDYWFPSTRTNYQFNINLFFLIYRKTKALVQIETASTPIKLVDGHDNNIIYTYHIMELGYISFNRPILKSLKVSPIYIFSVRV